MKITALKGDPPLEVTTLEVPRDSLGFIFTHGDERLCVQFVDAAMGGGAMPRLAAASLASFGIPASVVTPLDDHEVRDAPLAEGSDPPLDILAGLCLEIGEQPIKVDKTVVYTRWMLRRLRLDHKMTQREWARKFGITASHISRIEMGQVCLAYSMFRRIEERLGVILDPYLLSKEAKTAKLCGAPHPRDTFAARLAAARGEPIPVPVEKETDSKTYFTTLRAFRTHYSKAFGDDAFGYGAQATICRRTHVASSVLYRFWNGLGGLAKKTKKAIEKGLKIRLHDDCLFNTPRWHEGIRKQTS